MWAVGWIIFAEPRGWAVSSPPPRHCTALAWQSGACKFGVEGNCWDDGDGQWWPPVTPAAPTPILATSWDGWLVRDKQFGGPCAELPWTPGSPPAMPFQQCQAL